MPICCCRFLRCELRWRQLDRRPLGQRNADVSGTTLNHTRLLGADLSNARNLTQNQLDEACGSDAKLPEGMTLRLCPGQR
jgi:uncharacterized protein YjbI with pentapeptide repeats